MKKIVITIGILAAMPLAGLAQTGVLSQALEQEPEIAVVKENSRNPLLRIRAEKIFSDLHCDVENVKWYEDKNGYFAYYTHEGNRGHTYFNKKGRLMYDAIAYQEKSLAPDLRDWVKSTFYNDYRITNVLEVRGFGHKVHFVQITDGHTWKNLKLQDGEMEIVREFLAR